MFVSAAFYIWYFQNSFWVYHSISFFFISNISFGLCWNRGSLVIWSGEGEIWTHLPNSPFQHIYHLFKTTFLTSQWPKTLSVYCIGTMRLTIYISMWVYLRFILDFSWSSTCSAVCVITCRNADITRNRKHPLQNDVGSTPLQRHFQHISSNASLDVDTDPNPYYSPTFIPALAKYFLPHAALWSGMMLGMKISNVQYFLIIIKY